MKEAGLGGDLDAQLLEIARNQALRGAVYDRIGEYCHHCRNRLNSLKLSLYLAKQQASPECFDRWMSIDRHYGELERMVERVQRLCRPMTLSRIRIGLELLIDDRRPAWSELWARRHDSLHFLAPPEPVVAAFDVDRLGDALDAVVAWRAEQGGPEVEASLTWSIGAGLIHLAWRESLITSAAGAKSGSQPDSRWSLPWLARVVSDHDGRIEIDDRQGWRLDLRWPASPLDR